MVMELNELRAKIADAIEKYATETRKTRAKRVSNVAAAYARAIAHKTWLYSQEHPDGKFWQWEQMMEKEGLLPLTTSSNEDHLFELLVEGQIRVKDTILIDSNKLIQSYDSARSKLQVTNWFNCSVADFRGEIFMAYRMDLKPFSTLMRIGLCKLDPKTLQPTQVAPSPLHIQSNYDAGWHVEDPRLFIHKDALHLSYTDGYQMGQARINHWLMTAEESFYIKKPMKFQTEKNWVLFSHEGELYSIYSTSPYKIFKMSGGVYSSAVNTSFNLKWDYGYISGGASPILHDGHYYHFFHSTLPFTHSRLRRQYYVGCYIFENKHPFKPVAITKVPLLAGEYCDPDIPRLSNTIFVVFACGTYIRDGIWYVSYGNNDVECRVMKISDDSLKQFMK